MLIMKSVTSKTTAIIAILYFTGFTFCLNKVKIAPAMMPNKPMFAYKAIFVNKSTIKIISAKPVRYMIAGL